MGHTIVGRLPNYPRWQAVVAMLQWPELDAAAVAGATTWAAQDRLRQLRGDPSLTYCFWLLTRLASAARGPDFEAELAQLGLPAQRDESILQFIARVSDQTRVVLNRYPESGPFGEMAALALRHTLVETVGTQGRSLFGSSLDDLEEAFQRHGTASQFGELAQRFFGDFMARTLRFYVAHELPHAVGAPGMASLTEAEAFSRALDRHTRETALLIEDFAARWYSRRRWLSEGMISQEEVAGFVAHALTKLRRDLQREAES
jgi:hypothetical protein